VRIKNSGVSGFEASSWFGLVAPARTPPAVVEILTNDVMKALADPDFARKLSDVGAEPGSLSGSAFGGFLRAETEKWGKVVKDSGTVMQ
jgi:tripartite-type tricarboxylate transporter receptor subunit TctC